MTPKTRESLLDHVRAGGDLTFSGADDQAAQQRVAELIQLIVSTREYQLV